MGANVSSAEVNFRGETLNMNLKKPWKGHLHGNVSSPCRRSKVTYLQTEMQWDACSKAIKQTNDLLVIDFTARWCGPSRLLEPKLKELAAKYSDVEFVKIEVDVLSDVAVEFNVGALPALVFVKRGIEVDRVVGLKPDELQKKIEKYRFSYY